MSHTGMVRAHTHSLAGTINVFSWPKNWHEINQFLAISDINFEFMSQYMVFSTCKNGGFNFRTLGACLHWKRRARRNGRLGVTFPSGRLRVKVTDQKKRPKSSFRTINNLYVTFDDTALYRYFKPVSCTCIEKTGIFSEKSVFRAFKKSPKLP